MVAKPRGGLWARGGLGLRGWWSRVTEVTLDT